MSALHSHGGLWPHHLSAWKSSRASTAGHSDSRPTASGPPPLHCPTACAAALVCESQNPQDLWSSGCVYGDVLSVSTASPIGSHTHKGQRETKRRGRPSRLGGGSLNKQGHLLLRFVLGDHDPSSSPDQPARILQVYTEASWGPVTYTVQTGSTTHHSLKALAGNSS